MLEFVFWTLALLIVYVYAGYPLMLFLVQRIAKQPVRKGGSQPHVTLVISAFNEREVIADKIENSLAIDYPTKAFEILVVSDASDDGTDEIVAEYETRGVGLLRMDRRSGKTLGLNAAVAKARGEVIVFSDANAMYQPDAIQALVAAFDDQDVGAVIGESSYVVPNSDSGRSESLYWRYETAIKVLESSTGSVVGGDGAIYAVRRGLYADMNADALSDFVNPLQVIQAGYRCTYEPKAVSFEETADDYGKEFRRKVRIVNRAWRAIWLMKTMLNPLRHGTFALKLWSHKILRWCVPFLLIGLLATNVALLSTGLFFALTLVFQVVFYCFSVAGLIQWRRHSQSPIFRIPFYFCLVNTAAALGLIEALMGKSYTTWTTARANA